MTPRIELQNRINQLPEYKLQQKEKVRDLLEKIENISDLREAMFFLRVLDSELTWGGRNSAQKRQYQTKIYHILEEFKKYETVTPIEQLKVGQIVGYNQVLQRVVCQESDMTVLQNTQTNETTYMEGFGREGSLRVIR